MAFSKEQGDAFVRQGLCCNGDRRPVVPGKRECQICIDRKERNKVRRQEREDKKAAAGICIEGGCQNPAKPGCRQCQMHIDRKAKVSSKRYYDRKGGPTCRYCDRPRSSESEAYCDVCLTRNRQRGRKRYAFCLAEGICFFCSRRNPKPALPGTATCADHVNELKLIHKRCHERRRQKILSHYGWFCVCCHLAIPSFLEIDHIDGGGNQHRKEIGQGRLYKWLIDNNFPAGYQPLCSNCNRIKHVCGSCPHQLLPAELLQALRQTHQAIGDYWKKTFPEAYQVPPKRKGGRKRKHG